MAKLSASFNIIGTNTLNVAWSGFTTMQVSANLDLLGGEWMRTRDAGNTDWVLMQHDGTDFNMTGTNTTEINIQSIAGGLKIWDSGNTDSISISHDDTDVNIACVNTTDINITGASLNMSGSVIYGADSFYMIERAAAPGDKTTSGQLWVKNDDPNVLMYTNGDGTDFTVDVT